MRQGKVAKDVVIEACFIPMQLPAEDMVGLQFASLRCFTGAPKKQRVQLRHACDYCNNFCAPGSVRLALRGRSDLPQAQHTLVDGSLELEKIIPFVADNISVLIMASPRFIDGLAQIACIQAYRSDAVIEQDLFRSSAESIKTPQSKSNRRKWNYKSCG